MCSLLYRKISARCIGYDLDLSAVSGTHHGLIGEKAKFPRPTVALICADGLPGRANKSSGAFSAIKFKLRKGYRQC
jgi:hypothetical protein